MNAQREVPREAADIGYPAAGNALEMREGSVDSVGNEISLKVGKNDKTGFPFWKEKSAGIMRDAVE